jgi:two-component system, sensor histidine kinase PdtaS
MNLRDALSKIKVLEAELGRLESQLKLATEKTRCAEAQYEELRHRIKNDLQVLTTVIAHQAKVSGLSEYCGRCLSRLANAATLHGALDYDVSQIVPMAAHLASISDSLKGAFDHRVKLKTSIEDDVDLTYRHARSVGLIYAEAVMNALKHGFPSDAAGTISMCFRRAGDTIEMTISDDGQSLPPSMASQPGQGMKFMKQLASDLKGEITFAKRSTGASLRLSFPAPNAGASQSRAEI